MRVFLCGVAIVAMLALAAACGDEGEIGEIGTPTASPAPVAVTGPLLVYTKEVGRTQTESRSWPTLAVVTYDVGARRELASFEIGKAGEYASQVVIVGDRIAANLEERIVTYDVDGSRPRVLWQAPPGHGIIRIGASHDGTKLALTEEAPGRCDPECLSYGERTSIVVLDAASGEEIAVIPQSAPGFAGFVGQVAIVIWRDDGEGIVVKGYTHSEMPGGTATVLLDGSVRTHEPDDFVWVAPNGRYAAHGSRAELCEMFTGKREIILRDLDADTDLASVAGDGLVLLPWEWSLDSTELLYAAYATRPATGDPPCQEGSLQHDATSERWYVLGVDGSPPEPVVDREAVREQWYGERRVEFRRSGRVVGPLPLWPDGLGSIEAVDIYVGGMKVGSGEEVLIVGYIEG